MQWEEFVREWASQKRNVPCLHLSEPLTEKEVNACLYVLPEAHKDKKIEDAANDTFVGGGTVQKALSSIYTKCINEELNRNASSKAPGKKRILRELLADEFVKISELPDFQNVSLRPSNQWPSVPQVVEVESPEGVMQLDSRFYMSCDQEFKKSIATIAKFKGFVRIKSPRQMGKTSLLERILADSRQKGLRAIKVDLRPVDENSLQNLSYFLKWFCQQVASELELSIRVSEEWDDDEAANLNCGNFFENHLLDIDSPPLLLGIDNLDVIFNHPHIADAFLGLLRTWLEDQSQIWNNLRMIIVHAWHYKTTNVNRSPLNIGEEIKLPNLTLAQIKSLVVLHGLNWNEKDITALADFVGYHPYLIRLSMYRAFRDNVSISNLLTNAQASESIYHKYLERHFDYINSDQALLDLMVQVVKSAQGLEVISSEIDSSSSTKLQELGLIECINNKLVPKSRLFKLYFTHKLHIQTT
jgi:hypothetical protein